MRRTAYFLMVGAMIMLVIGRASAFNKSYLPYQMAKYGDKQIRAELIVDSNNTEYRSVDGEIIARLEEGIENSKLTIIDGSMELITYTFPHPRAVYHYDLDDNGLEDFLVFYTSRPNGLGIEGDSVDIFLKNDRDDYRVISYDATYADINDFVDLDNNGKAEIIVPGFYLGKKHNYFTYNIYSIVNHKMMNMDKEHFGFPKFVWFSFAPNDKDTNEISYEQRQSITAAKNRSFSYYINTKAGRFIK